MPNWFTRIAHPTAPYQPPPPFMCRGAASLSWPFVFAAAFGRGNVVERSFPVIVSASVSGSKSLALRLQDAIALNDACAVGGRPLHASCPAL